MIFLGAGASKPFGIKTLQEMTADLQKFMEERGYSQAVADISKSLNRFDLAADFEGIYTIIQAMTKPKESIYASGPLTAYVCKESLSDIPPEKCRDLLRAFREFLYKACQPNPSMAQKITEIYSKFFSVIWRCHYPEDEEYKYVRLHHKQNETIITTNYDMIIEQYFWHEKLPFIDGFKRITEQPQIGELDFREFSENHLMSANNVLIKLHGSIWNYKDGNNIFKTFTDPKYCPIPVNIEEDMMIFPINDKPILKYPYYDFYNFFREHIWERLIVVGYSFRDGPVNYAIHDHLIRVPESVLVVVDPNPEIAIKNFTNSFPDNLNNRIIPVKGEFGKNQTFEQLEQALKSLNVRKDPNYNYY